MRRTALALLALALAARADSVEFSDGRVVRGEVRLTRGAVFKLTTGKGKARRKFRLDPSDVASLEMVVVSETMERPYTWKNPGDPTKTYGEGRYPLRNLRCRLALRDGRVLEGDLISTVVYVKPAGAEEEQRFKLVRQQKGKVGQAADDLVYVRAIRLDAGAEPFKPATLRGRVDAPHPLEQVVACRRESNLIYRGRVLEAGGFEIPGLPAGTYDLFAVTTNEFLHPFPAGGDLAPLQAAADQASDFFEEREVAARAGVPGATRALVLKVRTGKTSFESELQGAKLWRLEIWLWHAVGKEWRLDRRLLLFRGRKEPDGVARTVRRMPALAGITLSKGEDKTLGE